MTKDFTMHAKFSVVALGALLVTACNAPDSPASGVSALHVPIVSQTAFVFDADAPGGMMSSSETERLDDWLASVNVGYGSSVYVDGPEGPARGQVAAVVGQYGLLLSEGAPVTPGVVPPGAVRVVVSRAVAAVPGCPDWHRQSEPDFNNKSMSNFGCGVNGALAAQVADANDLVRGTPDTQAGDGAHASKAITMYRNWPLTAIIDGQTKRPLKKVESTARKDK